MDDPPTLHKTGAVRFNCTPAPPNCATPTTATQSTNPTTTTNETYRKRRLLDSGSEGKRRRLGNPSDEGCGAVASVQPHDKMLVAESIHQNTKTTPKNTKLHTEFDQLELIGSGSFADVWKARNKVDGVFYAIKIAKKSCRSRATREVLVQEARNLAHLSCSSHNEPHIVRYYSSWFEDRRLALQTELCDKSLTGILKEVEYKINLRDIHQVIAHVASGLCFLHSQDAVHLDIKPDNILNCHERVGASITNVYKIADLGMSRLINHTDNIDQGDCRYLAPELMKSSRPKLLTKADMFSLGAMAYQMLLGRDLPLNGTEWHDIREGKLYKDEIRTHVMSAYNEKKISVRGNRDAVDSNDTENYEKKNSSISSANYSDLDDKLEEELDLTIHLVSKLLSPNPIDRPAAEEVMMHELILPYITRGDVLMQRAMNAEQLAAERAEAIENVKKKESILVQLLAAKSRSLRRHGTIQ
eukprot:Filipodium_phascolosomae@DN694_c0_g1_i1.p1